MKVYLLGGPFDGGIRTAKKKATTKVFFPKKKSEAHFGAHCYIRLTDLKNVFIYTGLVRAIYEKIPPY